MIRTKGNKTSAIVYAVIAACLAFVLGYLLGHGNGETEVQVTTVPAQSLSQPAEEPAETIVIPQPEAVPSEPEPAFPLDLNTASREELMLLPGIGPELAERIIAYRQEYGKFIAVEQIMDVDGIGEKRFEQIGSLIEIGGTQ